MNNKLNILVKYFDTPEYKCTRLKKINKGDWIDLYAAKDIFVQGNSNNPTLIPLGVAMKLPDGYEAHIAPRSSTFKTWGVIQTNSFGIIDNSYSGDKDQWMLPVVCLNSNGSFINAGKIIDLTKNRGVYFFYFLFFFVRITLSRYSSKAISTIAVLWM